MPTMYKYIHIRVSEREKVGWREIRREGGI